MKERFFIAFYNSKSNVFSIFNAFNLNKNNAAEKKAAKTEEELMAMSREDFYEWTNGASEEELKAMTATVKKRFTIFLLISLIPLVSVITMGFAMFCYNNYVVLKSRGRRTSNGLIILLMALYGYVIIPLIEVQLCSRIQSLGDKILGV